jgi:hypothetical protein
MVNRNNMAQKHKLWHSRDPKKTCGIIMLVISTHLHPVYEVSASLYTPGQDAIF